MINAPRRLSTGSAVVARIIGAVFGLIVVSFGVLCAAGAVFAGVVFAGVVNPFGGDQDCVQPDSGIPSYALPSGITVCDGGMLPRLGPVAIVGLLVGGGVVLLGVVVIVAALRGTAAWLDGTRLRVRGFLRTRTVDLSSAEVSAGIVTHSDTSDAGYTRVHRVPRLVARDPASGRTVTLSLQGTNTDHLPPVELRALADAITVGRPESDADVYRVAAQLRELADNPLELPR